MTDLLDLPPLTAHGCNRFYYAQGSPYLTPGKDSKNRYVIGRCKRTGLQVAMQMITIDGTLHQRSRHTMLNADYPTDKSVDLEFWLMHDLERDFFLTRSRREFEAHRRQIRGVNLDSLSEFSESEVESCEPSEASDHETSVTWD